MKNDHFRSGKALQAFQITAGGQQFPRTIAYLIELSYSVMQDIRLRPVISSPDGGHIDDFFVFVFGRRP